MVINIKQDLIGNPEPPTIILANRSGNKLGQLKVNNESIDISGKLIEASEFSFTINKYIDNKLTPLWDKIVNFKLVYCKEWDMWFEIKVELDEEIETVKTVYCTQLGHAELSQINLYDVEINTEKDIERDDYKISILCDENDPKASILHRMLEKAPHYSIKYVDPTIKNIQRSFSFDGTSIDDGFQEVAKEIGCLFVYPSNSGEKGKINRDVFVYDLHQNCNDCGYRGEYTDKCPKCGSTNIKYGYGKDTLIFVTADELASGGIQLVPDADSVKNCFKLEAGDDLMTATVRSCNPNGSDYIWRFSDIIKEDMSDDLVKKIDSYDSEYKKYCNDYQFSIDTTMLNNYNNLVRKYSAYNKDLATISTPIKGYSSLMNAYYNTVDLSLYLKSALMPSVEISGTTAKEQAALLTASALSPVAVADVTVVSLATANSAVLAMAKIIVRPTYKVEIKSSELVNEGNAKYWKGSFIVTNYSDDEDTAESNVINSVKIVDSDETIIKQKIDKALNKENTDDLSISGLFEKEYEDFCAELKKYALNPLISFREACQSCIDILIEQGVGDGNTWSGDGDSDLYKNLYEPYYNKLLAIEAEIKTRENEINIISGVYDVDGNLLKDGLQTYIEKIKAQTQKSLDFEKYLGPDLWVEFCSYRREDKYTNDNYISDGLNNAELFEKAFEFFEVAQNEIYKSSELQYSISTTLKNLLAIDKFKILVDSFDLGNWIRVRIDDNIYKLRLLEYEIKFSDLNDIPVEFSNVTKIKNGITDVQDILSKASSMATSYDYVQRQANQGNKANNTIENWLENGLNSALVQIQSNNNEDITLTKNGLLCRSYDDITQSYSPEQFKLTHNILAYTSDNWHTVSAALGKHEYTRWNNNQWIKDVDYGLSSKFVNAGYITGSQIIGGEIVSSNYVYRKSGTYINLINGSFDFAGGKIVYDNNTNALTLDGVNIVWDNTNEPSINNISGLVDSLNDISKNISDASNAASNAASDAEKNAKEYADEQDKSLNDSLTDAYKKYTDSEISTLDGAVANYLGADGGTMIGNSHIISPYIAGGYLNITNTNNSSRVIIDPNNLTGNNYIFQVHNGKSVSVGITKDGNALFSGEITATKLTIAQGANVSGLATSQLSNDSGYQNETGVVSIVNGTVTADYIKLLNLQVGNQISMGPNATISWNNVTNTSDVATKSYVTGQGYQTATQVTQITKDTISTENIYATNLKVQAANIDGTLTADKIDATNLEVDAANIKGTITASSVSASNITGGANNETITFNGSFTAPNATITGNITATTGNIGGWVVGTFTDGSDTYTNSLYRDTNNYRVFLRSDYSKETDTVLGIKKYSTADKSDGGSYTFYIQHDGYLVANAGKFSRDITIGGRSISAWMDSSGYISDIKATTGSIGGWNIRNGSLRISVGGGRDVTIDGDGVSIYYSTSSDAYTSATWEQIVKAALNS